MKTQMDELIKAFDGGDYETVNRLFKEIEEAN